MDFTLDMNQEVIIIPRRYQWNNITGETIRTKKAVVGMGINFGGRVMMADGVNEAGMTCATLYFPGFATYSSHVDSNKTNVAPFDFVTWSLTQFNSVEELRKSIDSIAFIDVPLPILGVTPPLHWILADKSGECIVLEPTADGIKVYDNPIGVMTNSPEFSWHLQNLRQYIGLKSQPLRQRVGRCTIKCFWPRFRIDGTSWRFHTAIKICTGSIWQTKHSKYRERRRGISAIFHILSNCEVPKGQ